MSWRVDVSRNAQKFLDKQNFSLDELLELVGKAVRHFQGERSNLDLKRLKGKWAGFYTIRKGRIRVIAEFDFEGSIVFIEEIDWRGNVYK